MKRMSMMLVLLMTALLIAGCGGHKAATTTQKATDDVIKSVPEWFPKPPDDPNYFFGTGTATSRDMQVARDKATNAAMMQITQAIETKFEGLRKMFQEEVGTADESQYLEQFSQATQAVVSQVVNGMEMVDSEYKNEDGVFRSYVWYQVPVGASAEALMSRIRQQEQMYTRFRSSETFQELQKEVDEFEEFKANQRNGG